MSKVVSKKLRETRQAKNLSLEHIANVTHIRLRYLEALESGDFDVLPSEFQVKGFIRSYGGYLGLNTDALIEALELNPWSALDVLNDDGGTQEQEAGTMEDGSASEFQNIGNQLRSQRETLGLTLEEIEQHTHLRIRYLKALEAGDIDALPSTVQGRGMLNNYASFLGLDAEKLLLEFAEGLQARLVESSSRREDRAKRRKSREPKQERQILSRDLVVGILLGLFLVLFIIWGAIQVTAIRADEEVEPTAPSIAEVLNPTSIPTQVPTLTSTTAPPLGGGQEGVNIGDRTVSEITQEVLNVSDALDGAVQVQIAALQRSWMRIIVDGEIDFDGRIVPGTIYGFAGDDYVEITTGNGAGLQVFYNDQDLGTLGNMGEVINFVITANGVQTPTPTITLSPTPTATETPEISPTPTSE